MALAHPRDCLGRFFVRLAAFFHHLLVGFKMLAPFLVHGIGMQDIEHRFRAYMLPPALQLGIAPPLIFPIHPQKLE